MGDLITSAVEGQLQYVPLREFERLNNKSISKIKRAEIFAGFCRINALYMIANAGSGHIGSSFSCMDVLSWLYLSGMNGQINDFYDLNSDIFFSSKGHDAPAIYSVLIGLGKLDFDLLHKLRRIDGLPGHPDISTPNIITNTGSLGMGISKAKGMIFANRTLGKKSQVHVLTGDGELQEGQIWESLISAVNYKMHELTVIVDHNKLQSDTLLTKVSDLGNLEEKFTAFGWNVRRCNGNDINEFSKILSEDKVTNQKPRVIIADTIKGKGVSFMEHTSIDSDVELYHYHSGAPKSDAYALASSELIDSVNMLLKEADMESLEIESIERPVAVIQEGLQKMIPAYTKSLLMQARINSNIVALNADLVLDTGLIPFKSEFPERFVECGIAEQDMVSQAGGMALRGIIPIVHSFACFLSSRPNEQIYNNATELSKIVYVGSLAGLIPAGPGHSHQAVRDIASLSAVPGLILIEPCCELEIELLLDWSINTNKFSSYIRLVSIPFIPISDYNPNQKVEIGQGTFCKPGEYLTIVSSGPLLSNELVLVAEKIKLNFDIDPQIILTPWLNSIDLDWYEDKLAKSDYFVVVENHYTGNGLGTFLLSKLSQSGTLTGKKSKMIGLDEKPLSGQSEEVLSYHKLDAQGIYRKIVNVINNTGK